MLPSFVSLAIVTDTCKNATIDMKREREEEQATPPPSVQPEEVIETFVGEYGAAYDEIRKANLATSSRSVFEENDVGRAKLVKDLQVAMDGKSEAERVVEEIRARGAYYTSEVGKAARRADPSLKMSGEQKREELRRLEEAKETITVQEKSISVIQEAIRQRNRQTDWLYITLLPLMREHYSPSTWKDLKYGFETIISLWGDNVDGRFAFDLRVAPWDNRHFRLSGLRWLQDLVFQRKLLSMVPNPKITIGGYDGPRITFGSDHSFKSGVEALEYALAITIAAAAIRKKYDGRTISDKPDVNKTQNLLGWDVELGMDDLPLSLKESFHKLQTLSTSNSFVHSLIKRVIDNDGYTRKLAILINTGDTGARALVARHSCVEFGLNGQKCATTTRVLNIINESSTLFKEVLYPMSVNVRKNKRDEIEQFRNSSSKVAFISWGQHARVIFKVGYGCAIVDPWKPAERVRPPAVIRDTFGSEPEWIDREPEQCGESSCAIIAMTRAVILSIAARNGDADALRNAAKSDLLDQTMHGPIAIMLVRCAHMIATPSVYPHMEVFQR